MVASPGLFIGGSLTPRELRGKPQILFEGRYLAWSTIVTGRSYDVSPDGSRFLMIKNDPEDISRFPKPSPIFVVLNWFEELKERVPPADR